MSDYNDLSPFSKENRPMWGLAAKWLLAGIIVVVLLTIVLGPIGLALGWYGTAQKVVSPENVTKQYHDAYQRYEDLQATAGNVCDEQKLVDNAASDVKDQYQQQLTAYQQNYRRIAALYNAAYDNAFEAKHVGPGDLPNKAPTLSEAIKTWC